MTEAEQVNGVVVENQSKRTHPRQQPLRQETLHGVLRRLMSAIFYPDSACTAASLPLLHRLQTAFFDHAPMLPDAAHSTATELLRWARCGSPLRALLVFSVSTLPALFNSLSIYSIVPFYSFYLFIDFV